MGKRLIALVIGVLAVGLVAGCGSDSSAASITKAEFIKQADAACEKREKQIQTDFAAYVQEHKDLEKPTKDDYAELIETVFVPSAEQEIDDIRGLGAPAGDEEQVAAILTAREEALEAAEDNPQTVIGDSEKIFAEATKLAKEYGLEACATR